MPSYQEAVNRAWSMMEAAEAVLEAVAEEVSERNPSEREVLAALRPMRSALAVAQGWTALAEVLKPVLDA